MCFGRAYRVPSGWSCCGYFWMPENSLRSNDFAVLLLSVFFPTHLIFVFLSNVSITCSLCLSVSSLRRVHLCHYLRPCLWPCVCFTLPAPVGLSFTCNASILLTLIYTFRNHKISLRSLICFFRNDVSCIYVLFISQKLRL